MHGDALAQDVKSRFIRFVIAKVDREKRAAVSLESTTDRRALSFYLTRNNLPDFIAIQYAQVRFKTPEAFVEDATRCPYRRWICAPVMHCKSGSFVLDSNTQEFAQGLDEAPPGEAESPSSSPGQQGSVPPFPSKQPEIADAACPDVPDELRATPAADDDHMNFSMASQAAKR